MLGDTVSVLLELLSVVVGIPRSVVVGTLVAVVVLVCVCDSVVVESLLLDTEVVE